MIKAELNIKVSESNVDQIISSINRKQDELDPLFLVVDLFCGAGGVTTGFYQSTINNNKISKVIACVNHDAKAIESHWKNHPEVLHFEEDIRTLDTAPLSKIVDHYKLLFPKAVLILWASLECTNFSKAKGGQPRDADSRTLADHLHRYITAIDPHYVQIENVVEFMSWGPLDENGKPISRKNGQDWIRWRSEINNHGYRDEWKELNSADFGAYTSRNRLFGCFAKEGLPIIWPEATHAKYISGRKAAPSLFIEKESLSPWKPVKDVLDFDDEGKSIFNRDKPLSEKTLERIYAGLVKYIAKGDTSFIAKYYSGRPEGKVISTNGPAGVVTTVGGQTLIQASFMMKYNSMNSNGVHTPPSLEEPCPTIACQSRLGIVQPKFLAAYYGTGDNISSLESPCPVIPTKDRFQLINPEFFIDKQYGKVPENIPIDQPAGTIMTNDKHRLVEAVPFIMPTNFNNGPKSIEEPSPVITASRKHHYLINPSWGGNPGSIDQPCCVVVARQDKAPLYFVQVESGNVKVPVYENDCPTMIKIKQFMAAYGLVDIKMRMLRVNELLKIQGFPENYHLAGNQTDQKKFIGNSVVPNVVKCWIEAMGIGIMKKLKYAA